MDRQNKYIRSDISANVKQWVKTNNIQLTPAPSGHRRLDASFAHDIRTALLSNAIYFDIVVFRSAEHSKQSKST